MKIDTISFYGRHRRHHKNQNVQNETTTPKESSSSGKVAKLLIASMIVVTPVIKSHIFDSNNIENTDTVEISETPAKKSDNIIEYAVNKVTTAKSNEKAEDDKILESKLIKLLDPIINGVGKKLFSSTKIRGKVEDKLFGEVAVEQLDEFLYSDDAKIKTKKILQDKEIQEALVQALANKHTDKNVKYLMENHDVQDALISILQDPNILAMLDKLGKENKIPRCIIEAVEDIMENASFIRLVLNNSYFQEMISEFLKHPDDGFQFKESKAELASKSTLEAHVANYNSYINATMHDSFISTTADSIKTFGTVGSVAGEGIGDIVGFCIPVVGKPIFGTTGQLTGGLIGAVYAPVRNSVNEFFKLFCDDKATNTVDIIEIKEN